MSTLKPARRGVGPPAADSTTKTRSNQEARGGKGPGSGRHQCRTVSPERNPLARRESHSMPPSKRPCPERQGCEDSERLAARGWGRRAGPRILRAELCRGRAGRTRGAPGRAAQGCLPRE